MPDSPSAGIEDPGPRQRPARGPSARLVGIVSAVLAVVAVVAVATAVWLAVKSHDADQTQQQRAGAADVASQFALRMDSFDGKKMATYSQGIEQLLTTKYKADFAEQFKPFAQGYAQAEAVGTGKVLLTAVGDSDDDSATVLVVHDGSVKSKIGQAQVRHQRWTVDLVKVKGRWLVDDFNPVS